MQFRTNNPYYIAGTRCKLIIKCETRVFIPATMRYKLYGSTDYRPTSIQFAQEFRINSLIIIPILHLMQLKHT